MKEWDLFLDQLKIDHPGCFAQNWTAGYKLTRFDAQNLYLEFHDPFAQAFFKEHIYAHLKQFKNSNGYPIRVHVEISPDPLKNSPQTPASSLKLDVLLDKELRLENFISDENNQFIFNLIQNLETSVSTFNPLFIYGAKSSGKTHLLQGACQHYRQKGIHALYVSAEQFSEQVVYAMRHSLMSELRKHYRAADMLFVDNIHHLAGKFATQEEFFHTFNSLQMTQKAIILSSEAPPSELKEIEVRLISRFEWGLSIELQSLSQNSFSLLLESQRKALDLTLSTKDTEHLLTHFSKDPSQLIQALQALALRRHLNKNADQTPILETLNDLQEQKPLTLDEILESCAKHFKLKAKEIKGSSQTRTLAFPRQMSMYLCRKWLNIPYKKLGEYFDRDHSTVMASITLIENKLKTFDEETLSALKRIEWELKKG